MCFGFLDGSMRRSPFISVPLAVLIVKFLSLTTSLPPLMRSKASPSFSAATTVQVPWRRWKSFLAASSAATWAERIKPTSDIARKVDCMKHLYAKARPLLSHEHLQQLDCGQQHHSNSKQYRQSLPGRKLGKLSPLLFPLLIALVPLLLALLPFLLLFCQHLSLFLLLVNFGCVEHL